MSSYVYINDDFVKDENALLYHRDLAIQRGYGFFDFFKVKNQVPLFVEDHLDRLYRSAAIMHITMPHERETIKSLIESLIVKNKMTDSAIRITVTGGYSETGYSVDQPNLIISEQPYTEPDSHKYNQGISLALYPYQRQLPEAKTIDYLMEIWLQPYIHTKGVNDVLYFRDGYITECPRSNFFIVTQNGVIQTPRENVLKGVTRSRILKAGNSQFEIQEKDITPEEALQASEAFITSTTKGIMPVTSINQTPVGNGRPGPTTMALRDMIDVY